MNKKKRKETHASAHTTRNKSKSIIGFSSEVPFESKISFIMLLVITPPPHTSHKTHRLGTFGRYAPRCGIEARYTRLRSSVFGPVMSL